MNPLEEAVLAVVKQHIDVTLNTQKVEELIRFGIQGEMIKVPELVYAIVDAKLKNFVPPKAPEPEEKYKIIHSPTPLPDGKQELILDLESLHFNAPTLVEFINSRLPIYMYGPTGSSKTKVVFILAEMLKLRLTSTTLGRDTTKSDLLGYNNATGTYIEGAVYNAYKNGGLLLVNEIDNGNATANVILNQLTDDAMLFPCGMIERHPDFCLIATANTLGNGANRQYVGRSQQDKSMLNRFVYLSWPWDMELERKLAMAEYEKHGGKDSKLIENVIDSFWRLRQAAEELNVDHILSMRNLLQHVRLIARGVDINIASRATVFRGGDKDTGLKLINKAKIVVLPNSKGLINVSKSGVVYPLEATFGDRVEEPEF